MRAHQEDAHRQPGARTHMWEASSPASAGAGLLSLLRSTACWTEDQPVWTLHGWRREREGGPLTEPCGFRATPSSRRLAAT